jgi:hypothetical protein
MTELKPEALPGLTLLQGLAVVGPGGVRREEYSKRASRSKLSGAAGAADEMTAGVGERSL